MCRLFGFRSILQSQVHRSLLEAENALLVQSRKHPDGWGVAYYVEGVPHVTRSPNAALEDALFHRLSDLVASETVLAHIRQATQGKLSVLNCHPFQYGRYTAMHNGDIPNFLEHREELRSRVDPALRRYIAGDTDSEVVFFLFLTALKEKQALAEVASWDQLQEALARALRLVRQICDTAEKTALLTFLLTDGRNLLACQGGKDIYYSTHKTRCTDRDTCPHFGPACEAESPDGKVSHLLVSSEKLSGDNVWQAFDAGQVVGVDADMRLRRSRLS